MNELLTICITNYNSSEFVLNTLYCLKKLTKNDYKVIIRDNNSKIRDFLNLKKKIHLYSNINLYRVNNFNFKGSMAHGLALNDLTSKIDTRYGVILDADCTFLHKDWDDILIKEINDEYPIIGTQAPKHPNGIKPQDFPYMFGLLFDNNIMKKLNVDFRAEDARFKDTAYKLKETYIQNGFKGKLIYFKSTRNFKSGPFRKLICGEFYLNGYKQIFACHFGRGSSLGIWKYYRGWKKNIFRDGKESSPI